MSKDRSIYKLHSSKDQRYEHESWSFTRLGPRGSLLCKEETCCYLKFLLCSEYALLTYGNMPVQPRFRVKFLLKFKYENVVRLAFQKKFYSKTRMDGHITIREKSVLCSTFGVHRHPDELSSGQIGSISAVYRLKSREGRGEGESGVGARLPQTMREIIIVKPSPIQRSRSVTGGDRIREALTE